MTTRRYPTTCFTLPTAILLSVTSMLMTGCGALSLPASGVGSTPEPIAGVTISGVAHGGQQPISGGTIQMYAAGMPAAPTGSNPVVGGYGQGATAMLPVGSGQGFSNNYFPNGGGTGNTCAWDGTNSLQCTILPQTDANGYFTISNDYLSASCTSATYVYLVLTGGNPGLGVGKTNPKIAMMTSLGACSTLSSSTFVSVDEVTTVGAVWALQQFMAAPSGHPTSDYTLQGGSVLAGAGVNVGASSGPANGYGPNAVNSQQVGLVNAFKMVDNIVDYSNWTHSLPKNHTWAAVHPQKVNVIANILAACVNSDGTTSTCSNLFSLTTVGSTVPMDTLQAAWMLAQHPYNTSATAPASPNLYGLQSATPPYSTTGFSSANLDFTLSVGLTPTFASGASASYEVTNIVIDAQGNPWVYSANASNGAGLISPATDPYIAQIAADGHAALAGPFQSYSASGGNTSGTGCTTSASRSLGALATGGMTIDGSDTLWVSANSGTGGGCGNTSLMAIPTDAPSSATGYYVTTGTPGALVADAFGGSSTIYGQAGTSHFFDLTGGGPTYHNSGPNYLGTSQGATVDTSGNIWMDAGGACSGGTSGMLYEFAYGNTALTTAPTSYHTSGDSGCSTGTQTIVASPGPVTALASDSHGNFWAVEQAPSGTLLGSVSYFAPTSLAWTTTSPITSGGVTTTSPGFGGFQTVTSGSYAASFGVAVDGNNNAWVSNYGVYAAGQPNLMEFSATLDGSGNISSINTLAGSTGFVFPNESSPYPHLSKVIAIDPSGNIWLPSAYVGSVLSVVVGAAKPVLTPLSYQAEYGVIGTSPQ